MGDNVHELRPSYNTLEPVSIGGSYVVCCSECPAVGMVVDYDDAVALLEAHMERTGHLEVSIKP